MPCLFSNDNEISINVTEKNVCRNTQIFGNLSNNPLKIPEGQKRDRNASSYTLTVPACGGEAEAGGSQVQETSEWLSQLLRSKVEKNGRGGREGERGKGGGEGEVISNWLDLETKP